MTENTFWPIFFQKAFAPSILKTKNFFIQRFFPVVRDYVPKFSDGVPNHSPNALYNVFSHKKMESSIITERTEIARERGTRLHSPDLAASATYFINIRHADLGK